MKTTDKYLHIIAERISHKINEKDIKTIVPIVMPYSLKIIGIMTLGNYNDSKKYKRNI